MAGMLSNVRRMVTKAKKEPYARCRFEDLESEVDMIVFPKAYASGISQYLKPSDMVVVTGKVNRRAEDGMPEILSGRNGPSREGARAVCERTHGPDLYTPPLRKMYWRT